MLLEISERERDLLLEVLGRGLRTLREVDTPGYETIRQENETLLVGLRERLVAQGQGTAHRVGGAAQAGTSAVMAR